MADETARTAAMPSASAAIKALLIETRYRLDKWEPTSVDDAAMLQAQVNALESYAQTLERPSEDYRVGFHDGGREGSVLPTGGVVGPSVMFPQEKP